MTKISVIGATSPLGVSLIPALVSAGYDVNASFRERSRIPDDWNAEPAISYHEIDLTSDFEVTEFATETVVWLAHIDAGRYNERETEVNVNAFDRFLSLIDTDITKQVIFVSSGGSVYGEAESLSIREDQERRPLSTYGKTKRELEDRLMEFRRASGIRTAILRPGNIYGFERPDRKTKGVTAGFLRTIINGSPFTIIHGGKTVRDFVYVDDVCRAIILAVKNDSTNIVWNVGTGRGTSTLEVLNLILQQTGAKMPELIERENFSSDVLTNILDVERIRREANWSAEISLDEGMRRTLRYWNVG
ncbi:MAG TPA: NAD-dependent epimerase/dehydratase family protein [Pyrinomonadaceae bacterium]|nr:NAD-dependent epimerase/dehydratase family protein [Pyrinomonadaceae bacterium]